MSGSAKGYGGGVETRVAELERRERGREWGRDYIIIDCTGGSTTKVSAPNLTDVWDQATREAAAGGKRLVLKGAYGGARRWIKLNPERQLADGTFIEVSGRVGIVGASSVSHLLRALGSIVIWGDLVIDGNNELETVAGGYVANHTGLLVQAATYGTRVGRVHTDGPEFTNFGYAGLESYFVQEAEIDRSIARRIGYGGFVHWSPLILKQRGGGVYNVFPGAPPGTGAAVYERNAYGITASQYSTDPQAEDVLIDGVTVDGVYTWEGVDVHSAKSVRIVNSRVKNCAQGIAAENHIAGLTMESLIISTNDVVGFGTAGSYTKDGLICYSQAGIVANSSGAPVTSSLQITTNTLNGCGERRPTVTSGGAAIMARHARSTVIANNVGRANQQVCMFLKGYASNTDWMLETIVAGNIFTGLTTHEAIAHGIKYGSHVSGGAKGNSVTGAGSAANSYIRDGAATLSFDVGTVGGYGTLGADNYWN